MTPNQYSQISEGLATYSTISAALEQAEANIKTVQLDAAKALLPEHAQLKVRLAELETQLRALADAHYAELFPEEKRTHSTPFGEIKYHKASSLDYDDEEKVLLKIKLAAERERDAAVRQQRLPRFSESQLIRTRESLNIESLETLDETLLASFGIRIKIDDKFSIKPFTMKSDKPVKKPKQEAV